MTRPKTPASAPCVPAWLQHHREEPQPCLYTRTFISRPTSPPAHVRRPSTEASIPLTYNCNRPWPPPPPSSLPRRPSVPRPRTFSARRHAPSSLPTPINANTQQQWDQCLSNLIVKSALGAGFGIVFSVLLFKRRAWPATIGLGFGAGRGYAECDREFKGSSIAKMAGERLQRS